MISKHTLHKRIFQLLVLFIPTQLSYHWWPSWAFVYGIRVDYLAPTLYFTDLLVAFLIVVWVTTDKKALQTLTKYSKWGIVVFVFALINIFFSKVTVVSTIRWLRVLELFLLFAYVRNQEGVVKQLYTPLSISAIYTLVISLGQMANHGSLGGALYFIGERAFRQNTPGIALVGVFGREVLRPYATFPHPNALAGYYLVSTFILLKSEKFLHRLSILVCLFLVAITFSQNAWMALLVAPVIYHFVKKQNIHFFRFVLAATIFSVALPILSNLVVNYSLPREVAQRVELNIVAGHLVSKNFLLGVGLGMFPALVSSIGTTSGNIWWLQPVHNIFLLLLSETGIVGLAVFGLLMTKIKYVNLPIIAIILTGLLDHYWLTLPQTMFMMAIVLALSHQKNLIQ